jgi:hypothetical protein
VQFSWGPYYSNTRSDLHGNYAFTGIPSTPNTYAYVTAENPQADLYLFDTSKTLQLKPREHKTGVDLVLYKGWKGTISGKVTGTRTVFDPANADETTRPLEERYQSKEVFSLPGMEIRLQAKQNHYRGTHAPILLERFATTDESGNYKFENLPPFCCYVELVSIPETYYGSEILSIPVESEPVTDADFELGTDGVCISGRITDSEGKPLPGITVFEDKDFGSNDSEYKIFPVETDADGRYLIPHLPPPRFLTAAEYLSIGKYPGDDYQVVAAGGDAFKRVPAITENTLKEGIKFLEAVAKKAGKQNGIPQIASNPQDPLPKSEGNTITDVDFVLGAHGSISGYVVDTEGKSMPRGEFLYHVIELRGPLGNTQRVPGQQFSEPTYNSTDINPDGNFEFRTVQSGQYALSVYSKNPPQSLQVEPTTVTVKDGERIENLRVTVDLLKYSASLEFSVLDLLTRRPPKEISCRLEYKDRKTHVFPVNGEGEFIFPEKVGDEVHYENLPIGRAKLSVNSFQYSGTDLDVEIKPGQNTLDPILLKPFGKFVLHVQESGSGKPINEIGGISFTKDPSRPGTFIGGSQPPGEHIFQIVSDGYGTQIIEVKIEPGQITEQTVQMKPCGYIWGQITCEGKPVSTCEVLSRIPNEKLGLIVGVRAGHKVSNGFYLCPNIGEDEQEVCAEYSYSDATGISYTVQQYDSVWVKPGEKVRKDFRFEENAGMGGSLECPFWAREVAVEVRDDLPDLRNPGTQRLIASFETRQNNTPYRIRYLSPGTYTVTITYKDEQYEKHQLPPKTVTLQPGQIGTVDIAN